MSTNAAPHDGLSVKRVGSQSIVYAAGSLIAKGVSFLLLPLYTRHLTPADYGVMALIDMTLDVIAIAAGARLVQGVFRFYYGAQSEPERRAITSTALWLMTGTHVLIGLVVMAIAPLLSSLVFESAEFAGLLRIAGAAIMCQGTVLTGLTYLRARERPIAVVGVELGKVVVQVVLTVFLLVHLDLGVRAVFLSNLVASVLTALGLGVYLVREVGIHWSRNATRDLARYGLPLVATNVATFLLTFGDRYFIQRAASEHGVGIYSLANQFGFLLVMLGSVPFQMVWEPMRFRFTDHPDRDGVYDQGFRLVNVVVWILATGIALLAFDVLRVMTTPAFVVAAQFVPLILLTQITNVWSAQHDIGILVQKRTEWVAAANWVAALVALCGYSLFVPRYLAWGAAAVTLASCVLRHIVIYVASQRLMPVRYSWAPVARLALISLGTWTVALAIPTLPIVFSVLVNGSLLGVYLFAIWHAGVLTEVERAQVLRFLRTMPGRASLLSACGSAQKQK